MCYTFGACPSEHLGHWPFVARISGHPHLRCYDHIVFLDDICRVVGLIIMMVQYTDDGVMLQWRGSEMVVLNKWEENMSIVH